MARYIDADELIRLIEIDALCQKYFSKRDVIASIKAINTADVVLKSEYENLVEAIDNTTQQFLELHYLYQNAKSRVAKEIFKELDGELAYCLESHPYAITRYCEIRRKYTKLNET